MRRGLARHAHGTSLVGRDRRIQLVQSFRQRRGERSEQRLQQQYAPTDQRSPKRLRRGQQRGRGAQPRRQRRGLGQRRVPRRQGRARTPKHALRSLAHPHHRRHPARRDRRIPPRDETLDGDPQHARHVDRHDLRAEPLTRLALQLQWRANAQQHCDFATKQRGSASSLRRLLSQATSLEARAGRY